MNRSSSKASRVWLAVLGFAVLIALGVALRNFGGGRLASEAASREPQRPLAPGGGAPMGLAAPASEQRDDVPLTAAATATVTPAAAEQAADAADPFTEVWAVVAQLETLASKPATYHDQALPVLERLTDVCRAIAATEEGARRATDVWATLLEQVVRSSERGDLVRGAVALAIARDLPEADFWRLFDEWLALPREGSLELVRVAALAAALRGDEAPCHRELGLSRLTAMAGSEMERPGIYPLSLRRIASPAAGAALRRWLDLPDLRRALFRGQTPAIEDARALASALDYFVASEVLFCVWGHGAIVNSAVERELVRTALCETGDSSEPDLLTLRAAHFVLRTLAECSAGLADGALRASTSSIPIVAGLAKSMESLGVSGLSLKLMAEIERLRFSQLPREESDLLLLLMDAGDALELLGRSRTAGRDNAIEYLLSLATDPNVTEMGRGGAIMALVDNVDWSELLELVRRTLSSGLGGMQNFTALRELVEAVGGDASRRAQAIAVLEGLGSLSLEAEVRELVSDALGELRG